MQYSFEEEGNPRNCLDEGKPRSNLKLHVLASGSKGNAAIIEAGTTGRAVLVDCGISKRNFLAGCDNVGFDPSRVEAILITHEHTDHTKGLGVVLRGLAKQGCEPKIYVSKEVARKSNEINNLRDACDIHALCADQNLSLAGLNIHPFETSHDSVESYGFRFVNTDGDAIGYMTDTGIVTPQAYELLQGCRILALESNHDEKMLHEGPYPYVIKRRVASEEGHLSNKQTAEVLQGLLSNHLHEIIALHISENNNTYRLPQQSLLEVVERNSHSAHVQVAYQNRVVSL